MGVFNGGAQKDIATSLSWLGVSDIKKLGFGLMEGVIWNELSQKRKNQMIKKVTRFSKRYLEPYKVRKGIVVSLKFMICKGMHKAVANAISSNILPQ